MEDEMKKTPTRALENDHGHLRRTIAVVGGITGLEPEYKRILEENNLLPKIYNQDSARLVGRIKGTDAIILFTGTVSHKMAEKIRRAAKVGEIPLINVQPSSISALRKSVGAFPPRGE
jgi:hypothetical protein